MGSFRLAQFARDLLPDLKDKPCPYMGLEAFRDQTFFFGRESDIRTLLDQVHGSPLVVVIGASGSGKSSLVMGGVLPALPADQSMQALHIIRTFVPGKAVLGNLAAAVLHERAGKPIDCMAEVAAFRANPQHLCNVLDTGASPTLITIDQFEEVFTLSDAADREALAANLAQLLKDGRGHRVILTVREEFKNRMVELRQFSRYLDKAWYSIRPMGYDELMAAVERPAALVNLQFQSGIVDDLVKKVLGQPAALPLLQFTLRELWESRDRNRITWEVYHRTGDPLNALKASADRFYEGLAPQTQGEIKRLLLELVRVDELLEAYRQPVPKSELIRAGKANTEEALRLLAKQDYISITDGGGALVEIKHESLVRNWPRLVGWIDEKRHQLRQRLVLTEAAQHWADSGKPQKGLLTGWQLEAAVGQSNLSVLEKEFIQASAERVQRERDAELLQAKVLAKEKTATAARFRKFWFATILLAVATIFFAGIAALQQNQARIQERKDNQLRWQAASELAQSRERVLRAMKLQPLNYVDDQLDLALLLAIEANRVAGEQPEVRRSLLSALTANLEVTQLLPGHKDYVRAVAFSADGTMLASGSYDSTLILWNVAGGLQVHAALEGHEGAVYRIAFSPDGKILASASDDGAVRLWNVATGDPIGTLPHEHSVYSVAFRKDGKMLASGGEEGIVKLWNIEDQQPVGSLKHHNPAESDKSAVYNVAFSPDGALLASGGKDGRILLWDVERRQQDGLPLMVHREVFSMAFSNDGKTIASGNQEGRVDLWDVPGRKWLQTTGTNHSRAVYGLAFSPDGSRLATVSTDGNAYIYDDDFSAPPRRLKGRSEAFTSVDISDDGKVATGTGSGITVLWNLNEFHRFGEQLRRPSGDKAANVFFGPENKTKGSTLISSSQDRLQFWDKVKGKFLRSEEEVTAAQKEIALIVLAPDRQLLVTIGTDNSVKLWDAAERQFIKTLVAPGDDTIMSAAFNMDNTMLAIGGAGQIKLLSLSDRRPPDLIPVPEEAANQAFIRTLVFSPDGTTLAFGGPFGIGIWDIATRAPFMLPVRTHEREVLSLAFSRDGTVLVSGGVGSVQFWDGKKGESLGRPLGRHPGVVTSVEINPDGKTLASASDDGTFLLWDLQTRQPLSKPIGAHAGAILSAVFSPNGQWLASSASDGSINLWPVNTQLWLSSACRALGRNLTEDEWKQFFGDQKPHVTCPDNKARDADMRALEEDYVGAEGLFKEALLGALEMKNADINNRVCWLGSVNGFAKLVKPACEDAVKFAAEGELALYRDSRGLARALTEDYVGATEDFMAAVESIKDLPDLDESGLEFLQRREQWITALKQGRNPFNDNDALLRSLRLE